MKKKLSLLLAIIMVAAAFATALPVSALAAEPTGECSVSIDGKKSENISFNNAIMLALLAEEEEILAVDPELTDEPAIIELEVEDAPMEELIEVAPAEAEETVVAEEATAAPAEETETV